MLFRSKVTYGSKKRYSDNAEIKINITVKTIPPITRLEYDEKTNLNDLFTLDGFAIQVKKILDIFVSVV